MLVTANLCDLTGQSDVGWCTFSLTGFGSSVPVVLSSPPVILSTITCKALANSGGLISLTIIGNDTIQPTGTTYQIEIFSDEGSFISAGRYSLTGGSVDLSTLTQL